MSSQDDIADLDIVIPVWFEGRNILPVLDTFARHLRMRHRILICYDLDDDDTLPAIAAYSGPPVRVELVKNPSRGPHSAVLAGFAASTAPAVLVYMADDDYNADIIEPMLHRIRNGADVVAASRFVTGGSMVGCPWFKRLITVGGVFLLRDIARMPVADCTNAFRMFSRRLIDTVEIESTQGFTFSVELLVKAVRLGWRVEEVAAQWFERADKPSRFRIIAWLPAYLRWLFYAMATTWLRRGPAYVRRKATSEALAAIR